jgi:pimeloyl-ACP methyl ester carboxylesterase
VHIQDVVNLLEYEDLRQVVLVGHSYAGMVVTGVADRANERIAHLVYLDAFLPRDGETVLDDYSTPERSASMLERAQREGEGWRIPPPLVQNYGVADELDAQWANAKLTPQPLRTFTQPLRLQHELSGQIRTYIACVPLFQAFASSVQRASADPNWRFRELTSGHDAMITVPDQLAEMLLDAARSDGTAGNGSSGAADAASTEASVQVT